MILLLKKNWYVEMRDGFKLDLALRLKWSDTTATGLNNVGQVMAIAVVPEPKTYALMLIGLGLVEFMAWRKKAKNPIKLY